MTNDPVHRAFLGRLVKSLDDVLIIAKWFIVARETEVRIPGMRQAKEHKDWKEYSDEGDLFALIKNREGGHTWRLIEVKALKAEFTCREDWPHKKHFMVDGAKEVNPAKEQPYLHICLSSNKEYIGYFGGNTRDLWYTEERFDTVVEKKMPFVFIPTDRVNFRRLYK